MSQIKLGPVNLSGRFTVALNGIDEILKFTPKRHLLKSKFYKNDRELCISVAVGQ